MLKYVGTLIMWPFTAGGRSKQGSLKAGTTELNTTTDIPYFKIKYKIMQSRPTALDENAVMRTDCEKEIGINHFSAKFLACL